MYLNETYSRVWVGKHLSDMFPIRNEYAIRRFQENQDGLKLNGTHQLLVDADDVNILGSSIHTIEKNVEALLVARKETGLQVNADKTKYMVMSRSECQTNSQYND